MQNCFVRYFLFFFISTKVSIIDGSSPFASAYNIDNIIGSYQDRNCKLIKVRILFIVCTDNTVRNEELKPFERDCS